MDWVTLGALVTTALIAIGVYKMKVEGLAKEMNEFKETFVKHAERDDQRFDNHTRRLNDQEVSTQAIHTSLQFIITKLDKIEDKVG